MFKNRGNNHKTKLTGVEAGFFKPVISVLILAWPVVIEMGLHTFVWIFDTAMVMRLGAHEATAVEYGALVLFNTLMIIGALGIGANSLVARYTGAKDLKQAALTGGQALAIALIFTVAFYFTAFFSAGSLFAWVIDDPITVGLTNSYFYTTLNSGGFAFLPWLVCSGIIRGSGNTRVPMKIALVANVYNIIGDYVLIFGHLGFPAMGVQGAALATGSAQLIGFLLSVGYLFFRSDHLPFNLTCLFPLRGSEILKVLRLSVPAGAEEFTHSGSRLITASWITTLGPIAFAANAAAIAAESFSFMPGQAFAIAATTLVGQRIGAGLMREARELGYWAAAIGTILMTSIGMIFLFFPYVVMSLFDPPDPEVLRLGALCLQVAAVEQPFIALTMTFSGALKGTGDTKTPFKVGLYTNLLIRLPLIYAVVYIFELGIVYIWWVTALQYAISALLLFWIYRRKDWTLLEPLPSKVRLV